MGRGTLESAKSALLKRRCAVTTIHSHRSLPLQQGEAPALLGLWGQPSLTNRTGGSGEQPAGQLWHSLKGTFLHLS